MSDRHSKPDPHAATLLPVLAARAASCMHAQVGTLEFADGTFMPIYYCEHPLRRDAYTQGERICLRVLLDVNTRQPSSCKLYERHEGHESISLAEMGEAHED